MSNKEKSPSGAGKTPHLIELSARYDLPVERYAGLLEKREINSIMNSYTRLAEGVLFEGDVDVRKKIAQDVEYVAKLLNEGLSAGSKAGALPTLAKLCEVIGSPVHEHSTYGKMIAAITYCEISILKEISDTEGSPRTLFWAIEKAIKNNPHQINLGPLIFGAYRGRLLYFYEHAEPEKKEKIKNPFANENIHTKEEAREDVSLWSIARVFQYLLEQEQLELSLPLVSIAHSQSKSEKKYPRSPEGGYPSGVIFLHEGSIASMRKLSAAAIHGVPRFTKSVLESRLPRILIGTLSEGRGEYVEEKPTLIKEGRRFSYAYALPLRKPRIPAKDAFGALHGGMNERSIDIRQEALTDENVIANASFDSLSYMFAIRIARNIVDDQVFEKIEEKNYTFLRTKRASVIRAHMEKRKLRAFERRLDLWMDKLTRPLENPNKEETSILAVALAESRQVYGSNQWGPAEAVDHIRNTVRALVLRNSFLHTAELAGETFFTGITVRSEEDVMNLYKRHILLHDLSEEDKLEFALRSLSETSSRLWHDSRLNDEEKAEVLAYLERSENGLKEETQQKLANIIVDYIQVRCETIRNTRAPKAWEAALLDDEMAPPDESDDENDLGED